MTAARNWLSWSHAGRYVFILPLLVLLGVFFIYPLIGLLGLSFQAPSSDASSSWSAASYWKIVSDSYYLAMFGNSLLLAALTTLGSLIIGYAVAFYLIRTSGWERTLIAVACLLPIFVNIIVGILGWYILLLPFGVIQQALAAVGLVDGPIQWLRSFWALVAILTYEHVPFAVLILASSLQGVPVDKINAARILGASVPTIIWTIMLPLTMPGIVATSILVFSLSISSYLVPILIAGPSTQVVPLAIFSYSSELVDWAMAGALAFILMVIVAVVTYAFIVLTNRLTHRNEWEMV